MKAVLGGLVVVLGFAVYAYLGNFPPRTGPIWRWLLGFFLTGLVFLVAGLLFEISPLPEFLENDKTTDPLPQRVFVVGAVLVIVAIACVVFALILGPIQRLF